MTGSRQVAKPAHCRPLPAGRGQTITKNPANIYHSQIVQMEVLVSCEGETFCTRVASALARWLWAGDGFLRLWGRRPLTVGTLSYPLKFHSPSGNTYRST